MPFDEQLAVRIRQGLGRRRGLSEKKMFGGLGFIVGGNMCVAIWHDALIARIGPLAYKSALDESHVREFDITGRPMKGWVLVEPAGLETTEHLQDWLDRAMAFASKLPPK